MKRYISIFVIIAIIAFCINRFYAITHAGIINSILSNNGLNNIEVDYVNVPLLASVPIIGQSDYDGYFTIKFKNGRAVNGDCKIETFDFNTRMIGAYNASVSINGINFIKLTECSSHQDNDAPLVGRDY